MADNTKAVENLKDNLRNTVNTVQNPDAKKL